MANFHAEFEFNDKVHIDGCGSVVATVIGFWFRYDGDQIQVSWFNSGTLIEQWIDKNRLAKVM